MKSWKIFITFFSKLYDDHYTEDKSLNLQHLTFVKMNYAYEIDLADNKLDYDIFPEQGFQLIYPDLQKKGYHENSVFYHIYKNKLHRDYDYIGFIEYDHVLGEQFTENIQRMIDSVNHDLIFVFNKFTFHQYWEQGILMNPHRKQRETGDPHSQWNCINVALKDYNSFYGTDFRLEDLIRKDCFSACQSFMLPSARFDRIMKFHSFIIDSGKTEQYHQHNWRSQARLMERYLAVELALQDGETIDSIQLEHRNYPIKVFEPDWFKPSFYQQIKKFIQKRM